MKARMTRYVPIIVFVLACTIGLMAAGAAYRSGQQAETARFQTMADKIVERVKARFGEHLSLLQATRSFIRAEGRLPDRKAFQTFVDGLDTTGSYDGIQGIGFALLLDKGHEQAAEDMIRSDYGIKRAVWPDTRMDRRAPVVLVEPLNFQNEAALGYDMFSSAARRTAMLWAISKDTAQATGSVQLVHGIANDKRTGFLVYLPYLSRPASGSASPHQDTARGFVYGAFQATDLFSKALGNTSRLPVTLAASDVTTGTAEPLFSTRNAPGHPPETGLMVSRRLNVAGRTWKIDVRATTAYKDASEKTLAVALGALSIVLAAALAMFAHALNKASSTALELQKSTEDALRERELMLHEQKHRIKNSIARIMAMARQTAAKSETLDQFSKAFNARLQAMASAQDMLTRSEWKKGDLRELLMRELGQVFGNSFENATVAGPDVELEEKAVQSLGLTFHELATNALKYGGTADSDVRLEVTWRQTGSADDAHLVIDWQEAGGAVAAPNPDQLGFGTALIDASITGELGGTIEREFAEEGLRVHIVLPATRFALRAQR